MPGCSLVTAFYPIKSKFPVEQYLAWASQFLQLSAPIVLFAPQAFVTQFQMLRGTKPIHIIPCEWEDLDTWRLYKDEWRTHHPLDPEAAYHSPELYAVWAQKPFFVAEAIRRNPFGTSHFFWCDIGAFRTFTAASILHTFPSHFPEGDRLLMNSVESLQGGDSHLYEDGIRGNFLTGNRIVGGLWGGTVTACLRWKSAYEQSLIRYFATGRFAGKDQSVMVSAILENPHLVTILEGTGDRWFFLQRALSIRGPLHTLDASYPTNSAQPIVTVQLRGGLGNQMFQIAAAFAYAKRHGFRLCLPATKEADGRGLYWDTVLHRFRHFLHPPLSLPVWWEKGATEWSDPPVSQGICFQGYFQSSRYFADPRIQRELRYLFSPSPDMTRNLEARYKELLEMRDRVVVIHARRTDYLKAAEVHGPLDVEYYRRAVKHITVPNPHYVLASDDPLFWLEVIPHLQGDFTILSDATDVETLALLSRFRHFILANSTFSWWCAWLAEADQAIVPARWFGPKGPANYEDIYEKTWIRI